MGLTLSVGDTIRLGLDHIFIRLGPTPRTPPPLSGLPAHTCIGTLPRWEPMSHYQVKITNIQVDITSIIPKLIDGVPSHAKGTLMAYMTGCLITQVTRYCHIGSEQRRVPTHMQAEQPDNEEGVGGAEPNRMKM